jgi:hypothetical protein
MNPIYQLLNKFTKKTFGNKNTPINHIAEFQEDIPSVWSRQLEYSEKPHISLDIKEEEIYNDLQNNQ